MKKELSGPAYKRVILPWEVKYLDSGKKGRSAVRGGGWLYFPPGMAQLRNDTPQTAKCGVYNDNRNQAESHLGDSISFFPVSR